MALSIRNVAFALGGSSAPSLDAKIMAAKPREINIARRSARSTSLSSLRRPMPGAYVPNLMRLFLRRAGLILATGSLVFFLSCERHHVGELPLEPEAKAPAEHHAATTHASPSPAARSTPVNFFPDKPKP
jgi:hypothetical protein